jgi:hypothetical protein
MGIFTLEYTFILPGHGYGKTCNPFTDIGMGSTHTHPLWVHFVTTHHIFYKKTSVATHKHIF